jgi:dTMP kinase
MSAARFITLEGIEGAGKSTVAQFVHGWLTSRGMHAQLTREPGGTPLAERVREIVLTRGTEHIAPAAETLLMFAGRHIHLDNRIRPALAEGIWIVCDRFTDATRAYQGGGRGVGAGLIEELASTVHPELWPDCTLLLDLPVPLGLARARARAGAPDRFEAEREPFFERVRAAYLELARQEPERIHLIDASQPLDVVQAQVAEVLTRLLARGAET